MTQSANFGQIRLNWGGFSLDTQTGLGYNIAVALGAWCNGNTWVSKTFVEGSSPSAPANLLRLLPEEIFHCLNPQTV